MSDVERLTPKQKTVLAAIKELEYIDDVTPTLELLRKHLGYSRPSSVQEHVRALKKKGYLDNSRYSRGLSLINSGFISIPLVGNVACGVPLLAEENVEAYVSYRNNKPLSNPDGYFFLRAVGDSMNKAGIDDGDLVLIRKQSTANPSDKVVALMDDEATIKRLVHENGNIILRPESNNPKYKDLIMLEEFTIQGVVNDVVKP